MHFACICQFTNTTIGSGNLTYKWDFGDGNISADPNPVNNYQNSGIYTVKLIAVNNYGCADTAIKPGAINVNFVKADFTNPAAVCSGSSFQLINASNPASFLSSLWDFGDGTTSTDKNPVKSYTIPGTYQVKMVTDFGSCKDSTVKAINITDKPKVDFTSTTNTNCSAPTNVTFTNTTPNSAAYLWNFGDGTTLTQQNAQHTYTRTGSYTVTLIATNASGCSDTTVKPGFVQIIPPKITTVNNLPAMGCIPLTVAPVAVIRSNSAIKSYFWDFGDGKTSGNVTPTHTYNIQGNYNVKLVIVTASGCKDSIIIPNAVKAGNKPAAAFSANSLVACASKLVALKDLSTGDSITNWNWTFGDGGTSAAQNPVHKFTDTGLLNVSLIVTNYGCSDTVIKPNYVRVLPPAAKFNATFLCRLPLARTFTDKSLGAKKWAWNFGDVSTSVNKNPKHAYVKPGIYPVTLKVTYGACQDSITKPVNVIDEHGKIVNDSASCANTGIHLAVTNINQANIRSYTWYFNGITQPAAPATGNPVITNYPKAGKYNAAAVIKDILNCRDTLYTAAPVAIYGPKADFVSAAGQCPGSTALFNDSTKTDGIHNITNWWWNFGDGGTQSFTNAPFEHQYNTQGSFAISLKVTDSYGCTDSIYKPNRITIARPVAKFTVPDTLFCPNTSITFSNQTAGLNNSYLWQFGDSATSADINPSHAYLNEGKYAVKLIVTNPYGCSDSVISYIDIVKTTSSFLMSDSFVICPPLIVNFTNTSKGATQVEWDLNYNSKSTFLNPSHIYTAPGLYTVKLASKNNSGCIDSSAKKIVVKGPNGLFSYTPTTICAPAKVDFTANVPTAVKYLWNYQEGNNDSTTQNIASHIYTKGGLYLPKLIVEDSSGCRFVISGKDTIAANDIKTNIIANKNVLCNSGTVHFSNNTISLENITAYNWAFDDGITSVLSSLDHTFAKPGSYPVKLQVTAASGCTDSASLVIKVAKTTAPAIIAQRNGCSIDPIPFSIQLLNDTSAIINQSWNFGNGQTSSSQHPVAYYHTPGNYNVLLSVTNSSGCISAVTKPMVINPAPSLKVTNDTAICAGKTIALSASGADAYTWVSAGNTLSCTDCNNPIANPSKNIIYSVKGTSAAGCSSVDSVAVKVSQPVHVTISSDTNSICRGKSVHLAAHGAPNYLWSPAEGLSSASNPNPVVTPKTTTTYQVVGYDVMGCSHDTNSVTVTVYDNPKVNLGPDKTITSRSSVQLNPSISNDVTALRWLPPTGLSCADCSAPGFISTNNITYKLIVENAHCSAEDDINIIIKYNNAKIVIPNAFSPNGDGINDVFYPTGSDASNLKSFAIYNRWGTQIFEVNNVSGNDPAYGWNGTWKGKPAEVGVYYYIIEVIDTDYKITKYSGSVTLLR